MFILSSVYLVFDVENTKTAFKKKMYINVYSQK